MNEFKGRVAATTVAALCIAASVLATASAGPAAVTAAAASCDQHGTLTYGIAGAGISALDPNTISFSGQEPLQTLLYNGLTKYAPDGTVQPDLATKWKSSKDMKTWTFTLRQGVEYASGRPFTAADAVANIKRVLSPKVASQARGNIATVTSAKAVGKYEVVLKLTLPRSPGASA